jgi:hypothetical protein
VNGRHSRMRGRAAPAPWRALRPFDVILAAFVVAIAIGSGIFLAVDGAGNTGTAAAGVTPGQLAVAGATWRVCGNSAVDDGPSQPPTGAVTVPAGQDSDVDFGKPLTTYWFAPGRHTLGPGQYSQIDPARGSVFTGAPGAVLDGQHQNDYAFSGYASGVTISYLTIENFGSYGGNQNEGVVNNDSAANWTIEHTTITGNAGAGVMLGTDDVLRYNCLSSNQQYGFNAYSPNGVSGLVVTHNEIVDNDTYHYASDCGCSGGGKFWEVNGAVVTDNYVHDNTNVGLWADTDNRGFDISGNYIAGNSSYGLIYEISYNALISHNTFIGNGVIDGPKNPSFPTSAIYISESGGDSRVHSAYSGELSITGNSFTDNWSGVILWENSNRFCNSPANTSSGVCTLVNPAVTLATCNPRNIARQPYFGDCRWETKNVLVAHNVFQFELADLGTDCIPANGCGLQGVFSEYGSYPSWSPYHGTIVPGHITFDQNNRFVSNTYIGPWEFMVYQQGDIVTWGKWVAKPYLQDEGSTLSS